MIVNKLSEHGYEEAVLGFSLSYNSTLERTKEILPKYAFGIPGENKFLESIVIWLDVTAPRFWWQEADTYRVGSTKQSESTMHTITKAVLSQENFEYEILDATLQNINCAIGMYKTISKDWKEKYFLERVKNQLPEGFLQRRIWCINYKCFQNIYNQRINHKLPQWKYFCKTVLESLEHPEFIVENVNK
jgi:hypothetical protein